MPGYTFEGGILPNIMFKTTPLLLLIVKKCHQDQGKKLMTLPKLKYSFKGEGLGANSNNINLKISFKFRKY